MAISRPRRMGTATSRSSCDRRRPRGHVPTLLDGVKHYIWSRRAALDRGADLGVDLPRSPAAACSCSSAAGPRCATTGAPEVAQVLPTSAPEAMPGPQRRARWSARPGGWYHRRRPPRSGTTTLAVARWRLCAVTGRSLPSSRPSPLWPHAACPATRWTVDHRRLLDAPPRSDPAAAGHPASLVLEPRRAFGTATPPRR
jgi:hypothetical protein